MQYGWTPLIWAADNGHLDVTKALLDKGADIEHSDKVTWGEGCEGVPMRARSLRGGLPVGVQVRGKAKDAVEGAVGAVVGVRVRYSLDKN